jgi:hypothetical protein
MRRAPCRANRRDHGSVGHHGVSRASRANGAIRAIRAILVLDATSIRIFRASSSFVVSSFRHFVALSLRRFVASSPRRFVFVTSSPRHFVSVASSPHHFVTLLLRNPSLRCFVTLPFCCYPSPPTTLILPQHGPPAGRPPNSRFALASSDPPAAIDGHPRQIHRPGGFERQGTGRGGSGPEGWRGVNRVNRGNRGNRGNRVNSREVRDGERPDVEFGIRRVWGSVCMHESDPMSGVSFDLL